VFEINRDKFREKFGYAEPEPVAKLQKVVSIKTKSGYVEERDENGELKGNMPF
jgi:hypothetical protein